MHPALPQLAALACLVTMAACHRSAQHQPPQTLDSATAKPMGDAKAEPAARPLQESPSPALVYIHEGQLITLGSDLKPLDRFPVSAPAAPSRLSQDGGKMWVYQDRKVHEVDLKARTARHLADLPQPSDCHEPAQALDLFDPATLQASSDQQGLCLTLADGPDNNASLMVDYYVALPGGAASHHVSFAPSEDTCQDSGQTLPTCKSAPRQRHPEPAYTLDEDACTITLANRAPVIVPHDKEQSCALIGEQASAQGRHLLVSRLTGQGDYIYRRLYVLDVNRGVFLPDLGIDVVGESRVQWSPRGALLLVDDKLYQLEGTPSVTTLNASAAFLP